LFRIQHLTETKKDQQNWIETQGDKRTLHEMVPTESK